MPNKLDKVKHRGFTLENKKNTSTALMPKEPEENYTTIPIHLIDTDSNIRLKYNDEDITDLSNSMLQFGQLEPIRVYDNIKTEKYTIIFGHRRFMAAKKAGLKEMKCFITKKPDTLEKIYIQAVENEHSVQISSVDREKYIKELHTKYKQSVAEIAEKLGKGESWVYTALQASKVRNLHESTFNNAGLSMTTTDTKLLSNATEEEVKQAVKLITKNPGSKMKVLSDISDKNKKKKGSRSSKLNIKNIASNKEKEEGRAVLVNIGGNTPETSDNYKKMNIEFTLHYDVINKKIRFSSNSSGDIFDQGIISSLNAILKNYLNDNGYAVEK